MNREAIPIPKSFTNKFPDLCKDKANKLWVRYLTVLSKYTMKPYLTLSSSTPISFPYKKALTECSTFNYKGERYWVWKEFGQGIPFIQLITKGSNITHKNSEIVINDTRHLQFALDTQNKEEIIRLYYGDCDDKTEFDEVPIDHSSLTHYIRSTEHELTKVTASSHKDTLQRNLNKAKTIKLITEYFYDAYNDYVLPQRISSSSYGRRYYKGINLQNCHKLLRRSCLGKSYEYDLKLAVYAIKLMVAEDIVNKASDYDWAEFFPRTKEYIQKKQLVRDTLAEYITTYNNPQALIKQVLTAVGFGAEATSPSWSGSAIADIVKNKENRIELLKDKWLSEFIIEQKDLTNFIVDYYLNVDANFKESIKDVGKMKVGNKYNKKQVMSYIFQTLEYQIMDTVCKHIPTESILLRVHDAVYTKHAIKLEQMLEIKLDLHNYSPLLVLEHDSERDVSTRFKFTKDYDVDARLHKQFIIQEESFAKEHKLFKGEQ